MSLFENVETQSDMLELIKLLQDLAKKIDNITEFSDSELKAISILESDSYLSELLSFYKINKKHIKRKHSLELIEIFKAIANSIQRKEEGG